MGIVCKRPKLELEHGPDYEEGKKQVKNYKQMSSALKKKVMLLVFEDETIVTQKPSIRKSMSFEGEQQKIGHNGSRKRFSMYISMLWPEQNLLYGFYDRSNSTNTIHHLENLRHVMKNNAWKRIVLVWDNASYHLRAYLKCRLEI